jgi:hypothetical protein
MYKKITHTIIEEHFDCPEAVDIAAEVENGTEMPMRFRVTPATVMPADQFRAMVQDWFLDMDARWQNLANANFDSSIDYEQAIDDVFVNVDLLGDTLKGYYGAEFGERFNQQWRSAGMNLLYIWRNIKNGWDTSVQEKNLFELLAPGSAVLYNQFNASWPRNEVEALLVSIYRDYIDYGKALKSKNSSAQASLRTKIGSALNQLSTTLASGVISRFPELFTAV